MSRRRIITVRPAGQSVEEYNIQRAQEFEEKIIWEQKETIAGIIMEPLITGGGILIPHPVYLGKSPGNLYTPWCVAHC